VERVKSDGFALMIPFFYLPFGIEKLKKGSVNVFRVLQPEFWKTREKKGYRFNFDTKSCPNDSLGRKNGLSPAYEKT